MNRIKATNIAGSLIAAIVVWFVLVSLDAPKWAAWGIAYLAYLMWRLGDKVRDGQDG